MNHLAGRSIKAVPSETYALGVEIGSRGIRAAIISDSARMIESARSIGVPASAPATLEQTFHLIEQLLDRSDLEASRFAAAGVAFGGPVDPHRGVTIDGPRTSGFVSYPLAGLLEERLKIPVYLENDARAGAVGEYRFGAGRGARGLVYMQFGIGVGGGIILEGRLLHGAGTTAGEFGHIPVSATGPRCSCGKPGHLEAYVSEPAILERVLRLANELQITPPQNGNFDIEDVFTDTGNAAAAAVAAESTQMIGMAIASLVTSLSCDAVVLGGYAGRAGEPFVGAVRARVRQHGLESAVRRLTISTSDLGTDASLVGVASIALERINR